MQIEVRSAFSRGSGVQTKVQKWENRLGERIPRGFAEEEDWLLVLRSSSQLRIDIELTSERSCVDAGCIISNYFKSQLYLSGALIIPLRLEAPFPHSLCLASPMARLDSSV
jgi:hypothetical protein